MEKAVRYMNDVENFKKVQAEREAARLAEQMGKQGKLVKEFPSGHRMVELSKPEAMDEQMMASIRQNADGSFSPLDADGKVIQRREMMDGNLTDVVEQNAEDAYLGGMLANEGNAMQHCVGGYCSDVSKGTHRIYSLRDTKGEPHVTIETSGPFDTQGYDSDDNTIYQIFGKQNTKPKDEYLPAIHDFIRSNNYGLADKSLADSVNLKNVNGKYYTPQEIEAIKLDGKHPDQPWILDYLANEEIRGYKDGGLIHGDDDFAMPGHF